MHVEFPIWQWDSHYFTIHSRIKRAEKKIILHTRNVTTLLAIKMLHRMWKDTLQNQKLGRFTATIISAENNTFVFRSDVRFDIKDTIILLIVSELLVRKTEN